MRRNQWSGEHKCPPGMNAVLFGWALAFAFIAACVWMTLASAGC